MCGVNGESNQVGRPLMDSRCVCIVLALFEYPIVFIHPLLRAPGFGDLFDIEQTRVEEALDAVREAAFFAP